MITTTKFKNTAYGLIIMVLFFQCQIENEEKNGFRERISINSDWYFFKYAAGDIADSLIYDIRPDVEVDQKSRPADAMPTEAKEVEKSYQVLKPWILPSGNRYLVDNSKHHKRPTGNPGMNFPFVRAYFNDSSWQKVNLPHDWAIKEPFYEGYPTPVGGGMGRLPSPGVAWYRKSINIPATDKGKSIFLDVDGAMSYAMVWLNGHLVGGWPYGYASWRLDLTPYIICGGDNQIAIRLDNPPNSSRWYPGGGIYRNVWLTKTSPVHVAHWGTNITTKAASESSATVEIEITIDNDSEQNELIELKIEIFELNESGEEAGKAVAQFESLKSNVPSKGIASVNSSVSLSYPKLWGPPPSQTPHMYVAVTTLLKNEMVIDQYKTPFGIRSIRFDPDNGLFVNNEKIVIKGANQHHDLGSLGAAFNKRAAERQLEILREMGCNAIRMAHNPPAPELLALTDKMGFLVIDEIFDSWERKKTPLDFHLIFRDWHEQDLRALIRRDRNHPSVIVWSIGNEVGEQYTGDEGAAIATNLHKIAREEDPTRPTTNAMNYAKPDMPLPGVMDIISLNYQGEGIRDAPAYRGLKGINTPPLYPAFHSKYPKKMIISSENAAALSSRDTYTFPLSADFSAPVKNKFGGDDENQQVSGYELYTAPFGSSADKVFASLDRHPYVAGGFVWSGWDYLGEPTPYYSARSSYYGVIDLAGFKKNRFYLYQSYWRPNLKMAHILPHWTWLGKDGEIIPIHVFSSADEAELFLNGISQGRKKKRKYEYRFRWDSIKYQPGVVNVVTYKDGKLWATDSVLTAENASRLELITDREQIRSDGEDLSFIVLRIKDENGTVVPDAHNLISFTIKGPGEIVSTDNGDPTCFTSFASHSRATFRGLALVVIRSHKGKEGKIVLTANSKGMKEVSITIFSKNSDNKTFP